MIDPRTDDGRHPPSAEPGWREWWGFDFAAPTHDLAGWCELVLFPHTSSVWFHAFVVGARRQLVAVIDHEVPFPSSTLEIRTTGLWADHICETPGEHWTVGLEAFAVGLDDPAELYGRQLGDQVPLGFDLEWECDDVAAGTLDVLDGPRAGYSLACGVSGEVLIGSEVVDMDGTGTRRHGWGVPDPTSAMVRGRWTSSSAVHVEPGPGGVAAGVSLDDAPSALEIVAVTPLSVPDPVLGGLRQPRALVTGASAQDWEWIEWTEPSDGIVS